MHSIVEMDDLGLCRKCVLGKLPLVCPAQSFLSSELCLQVAMYGHQGGTLSVHNFPSAPREDSGKALPLQVSCRHPNVVKLHEVFLTRKYLGIVMEYADGGDLSQFIDQQTSQGVRSLVTMLCM
jgi:serine/threonine protein kinase